MKDRLKNIGINVKSERLRKGLSQEELAEKCEISRNSISLIETGKINPTIIKMIDIAKVLNVDINVLIKNNKQIFIIKNASTKVDAFFADFY